MPVIRRNVILMPVFRNGQVPGVLNSTYRWMKAEIIPVNLIRVMPAQGGSKGLAIHVLN